VRVSLHLQAEKMVIRSVLQGYQSMEYQMNSVLGEALGRYSVRYVSNVRCYIVFVDYCAETPQFLLFTVRAAVAHSKL